MQSIHMDMKHETHVRDTDSDEFLSCDESFEYVLTENDRQFSESVLRGGNDAAQGDKAFLYPASHLIFCFTL